MYLIVYLYHKTTTNNIMTKNYIHKTGTRIQGYSSHEEHCFYENTTKRQLFLIVEQLSLQTKNDAQTWVEKATEELNTIKLNGIK